MGGKSSKQKKEEKIHQSNPESQLPPQEKQRHDQLPPQEKQRHDQLQNPENARPIELSWLQQNNTNDNYNRMDHIHHNEQRRRIPLAINRWPKTDEQKSKSFVEEYIHQ